MHDFVHAKAEFETAIQLNESVPQYHYQLSRACRELGEREQAEKKWPGSALLDLSSAMR